MNIIYMYHYISWRHREENFRIDSGRKFQSDCLVSAYLSLSFVWRNWIVWGWFTYFSAIIRNGCFLYEFIRGVGSDYVLLRLYRSNCWARVCFRDRVYMNHPNIALLAFIAQFSSGLEYSLLITCPCSALCCVFQHAVATRTRII